MIPPAAAHSPAADQVPVAPERLAVVVDGLSKSFGDLEVLKGVALTAHEGEVVTLIGASGSGKSTLLRCLNLLEIPTSGTIEVAGQRMTFSAGNTTLSRAQRAQAQVIRTRAAMVFQHFNLWPHLTALGNVIEAPVHVQGVTRADAIARGEALLERVGLADKRNQYPAFLSGGQQQRVAIARALAMQPRVLLFDEPTSALDPEMVGEVLRVIRALVDEGTTTMMLVTHEMGFARDVSTRVAFLHQGRIEELGPPAQVFGDPRSERCRQFIGAVL